MKLRTTNNSIRLRLSQSDVLKFAETGIVEERLVIGPDESGVLTYRIVQSKTDDVISANFENNYLTISVPSAAADRWTQSDEVGIEGSQTNGTGTDLSILIEKDFACLTPRPGDEDKDSFPHPKVS